MAKNRAVNVLVSILVGIAFLLFGFLSTSGLNLSWEYSLLLILMIILVYVLFLIVVFLPSRKRIRRTEFQEPVTDSIIEYKNPALDAFDEAVKESSSKPNKSYDYVGTEESKMYHKVTCRFAKLVKPKYRVEGDKDFFKKKKFKPCSICKPNKN